MQEAKRQGWLIYVLFIMTIVVITNTTTVEAQVGAPSWWGNQDNQTMSFIYNFNDDNWQPIPNLALSPQNSQSPSWHKVGTISPSWITYVAGHNGVWGLAPTTSKMSGTIEVEIPNPWTDCSCKEIWYQFDVYASRADICNDIAFGNFDYSQNPNEQITYLSYGWVRVTGSFNIGTSPQGSLKWTFDVNGGGVAAIDNVVIGARCIPEPGSIIILFSSIASFGLIIKRHK